MSNTTARRVNVRSQGTNIMREALPDVVCDDLNGDHRDLHVRSRRQRQMCIRDSLKAFIADKIHDATRERMLMEVDGE